MTTNQLIERVSWKHAGMYGHYKVSIIFRGKTYTGISTNAYAIDHMDDDTPPRKRRAALLNLYNEVKRNHDL